MGSTPAKGHVMAEDLSPAHEFRPGPDTSDDFRAALGRFGTGVTVVTCASEIGPLGITANSFSSVSLDPPLVLWSPGKFSRRYGAFAQARHFAIHVIGEDQFHICQGFARNGTAFDGLDWQLSEMGVPLINGCLSRFECDKYAEHDGGDHAIIVGRVTNVVTRPGLPLLFYQGNYGGLRDDG